MGLVVPYWALGLVGPIGPFWALDLVGPIGPIWVTILKKVIIVNQNMLFLSKNISLCYFRGRFFKKTIPPKAAPPAFSGCFDNYPFNHPSDQCPSNNFSDDDPFNANHI